MYITVFGLSLLLLFNRFLEFVFSVKRKWYKILRNSPQSFPKIVSPVKDISKCADTCYVRRKSSRPSALHCLGERKNHIHLSETNPSGSTFRKQSRLTAYCRHRATIRYIPYTHTQPTALRDRIRPRQKLNQQRSEESVNGNGNANQRRARRSSHRRAMSRC